MVFLIWFFAVGVWLGWGWGYPDIYRWERAKFCTIGVPLGKILSFREFCFRQWVSLSVGLVFWVLLFLFLSLPTLRATKESIRTAISFRAKPLLALALTSAFPPPAPSDLAKCSVGWRRFEGESCEPAVFGYRCWSWLNTEAVIYGFPASRRLNFFSPVRGWGCVKKVSI